MTKFYALLLAAAVSFLPVRAQNSTASQMTKDANNPLASITTVSLHNVYSTSLYGMDGSLNTFWIRAVQPIKGKVLIRASMPINTVDTDNFTRSGLGDLNIFATWVLTKPTAHNQFGIGPIVTIPTATSSKLGSGKWQAGVAMAGYFARSNVIQLGILATWQHSFAGSSNRNKVHIATIQPFMMWQMGKGLYMRSTATKILDFENEIYVLPLGAGMGKVFKFGNKIINIFMEPQFTIWHQGAGVPKMQLYMGINTQF